MIKKTILLSISVMVLTLSATAQDAMPTKGETVNYVNKRLQELIGKEYEYGSSKRIFTELSFTLKGDDVVFSGVWSPTDRTYIIKFSHVFNPAYISNTVLFDGEKPGMPTGEIHILFGSKVVRTTSEQIVDGMRVKPTREEGRAIQITFDPRIPEMGKRMEKALKHLRDLAKAEDDPFAN
jgi:hypothetical protein